VSHLVIHETPEGETIDIRHYCSDTCAQTDPAYGGWYGAQEYPATTCAACGEPCGSDLHLDNVPPARRRRAGERDWSVIMNAIRNNASLAWQRATEADRAEGRDWYPRQRRLIRSHAETWARRLVAAWDDATSRETLASHLWHDATITMALAGYTRPEADALTESVAKLTAHTLARLSRGTAWDRQERDVDIVASAAAAAISAQRLGKYAMADLPITRRFELTTLFTRTARDAWTSLPALYPYTHLPATKLHSFAQNLAGDDHVITLDRHMWAVLGAYTPRAARAAADRHYLEASQIITGEARRVGVAPAVYQATLWTLRKRERKEKTPTAAGTIVWW